MSHGGGLGTQEAVYYGIPVVCSPFFADQFINCDIVRNKKIGMKVNILTDSQEELDNALKEIWTNPMYK